METPLFDHGFERTEDLDHNLPPNASNAKERPARKGWSFFLSITVTRPLDLAVLALAFPGRQLPIGPARDDTRGLGFLCGSFQ